MQRSLLVTAFFLLQMAGAPGGGKSTLARALGQARSAVVLDMDVIKSAVLETGAAWSLAGPAAYEILYALAADLLAQCRPVILDSPSHYPQIPARGMEIAQAHGARYQFIECVCDDSALLEQRLLTRTPRRSQMRGLGQPSPDAGGAMPAAKRLGTHLWETCRPPGEYLMVDTSEPFETVLHAALRYLDR
jgi:predicted kinase